MGLSERLRGKKMEESICCTTSKGIVRITFENLKMRIVEPEKTIDVPYIEMDEENVTVYIDEVKQGTFGENFAGHKYNSAEVFEGIVIDYLNNNTSVDWIEIPECIREFKKEFFEPTGLVIAGRDVPKRIIEHGYGGNILTLHFASDGFTEEYKAKTPDYPKGYNGNTAYTDEYGTYALLDAEGSVITDIEAFYESGISSMWEADNIVFGREELAEIAKDWA